MGFIMTTVLGIAGSLVGGLIASALSGQSAANFSGAGFIGSLIGAIALLLIAGSVFGSRRRAVV
jgi:uncharacterized membrane protein YeaQ/YmgE (transglycosylase-associated protein family)